MPGPVSQAAASDPPRPLRLEWVDPSTLSANPRNWRTHPADQAAAFEGLLAEVGWADALLFNERTGRLLDGHMRREQALANRLPAVPVLVGSWDERAEAKVLASRDTLGLMAGVDPVAWTELLRDVETGSQELMGLLSDLSADWVPSFEKDSGLRTQDSAEEADDGPEAQSSALGPESSDDTAAPDVVFPSDNEWGIPSLDPRHQADAPQFPMTVWGSVGRKKAMPGTWLFYTADRKFDALFADPGAVLDSRPAYAVEPNYSTHPQMPRAFVLWGVYRKRWVNRWWQTKGVRTFVDLNVDAEFQGLNLLGVPRGWRAFATRSHSGGRFIESEWRAAADHAGTEELTFLVYGGGAEARRLCVDRGWFWCPEQSDSARGKVTP